MEKRFNGKAIYNPAGKAGEYAKWACNFYVGCSNDCSYCYCKKGVLSTTMGQNQPQLKKCFKDDDDAIKVFEKELKANVSELQKHGLFFSFTTDPMLPDTIDLTEIAIEIATDWDIPVYVLTKRADWVPYMLPRLPINRHEMYAFGFTLTGCDELEPNASTNQERIAAMKRLHDMGFKTFASIEPIIDIDKSMEMIKQTLGFCDLYKIGLLSGKRDYNKELLNHFVGRTCWLVSSRTQSSKIYWKESVKKYLGNDIVCARGVDADYNLFTDK
jgi:DNA repair photolyase